MTAAEESREPKGIRTLRRHRFEPGRLVAGLVVIGVAVAYGMDAAGEWDAEPFVLLPVVPAGLCAAGLVSLLVYRARRGREREEREKAEG